MRYQMSFPVALFAPALLVVFFGLDSELRLTIGHLRMDADRRKRERLEVDQEVDVPLI
jgi:hypothetical protein